MPCHLVLQRPLLCNRWNMNETKKNCWARLTLRLREKNRYNHPRLNDLVGSFALKEKYLKRQPIPMIWEQSQMPIRDLTDIWECFVLFVFILFSCFYIWLFCHINDLRNDYCKVEFPFKNVRVPSWNLFQMLTANTEAMGFRKIVLSDSGWQQKMWADQWVSLQLGSL